MWGTQPMLQQGKRKYELIGQILDTSCDFISVRNHGRNLCFKKVGKNESEEWIRTQVSRKGLILCGIAVWPKISCIIMIIMIVTSWILKSLVTNSTVCQQVVQSHNKNIIALHQWSFVKGIHRWPVDSPHMGPVMWKVFSCRYIFMMCIGPVMWKRPLWDIIPMMWHRLLSLQILLSIRPRLMMSAVVSGTHAQRKSVVQWTWFSHCWKLIHIIHVQGCTYLCIVASILRLETCSIYCGW